MEALTPYRRTDHNTTSCGWEKTKRFTCPLFVELFPFTCQTRANKYPSACFYSSLSRAGRPRRTSFRAFPRCPMRHKNPVLPGNAWHFPTILEFFFYDWCTSLESRFEGSDAGPTFINWVCLNNKASPRIEDQSRHLTAYSRVVTKVHACTYNYVKT